LYSSLIPFNPTVNIDSSLTANSDHQYFRAAKIIVPCLKLINLSLPQKTVSISLALFLDVQICGTMKIHQITIHQNNDLSNFWFVKLMILRKCNFKDREKFIKYDV